MDSEERKKALKRITYGLYVLTVKAGDEYAGSTVTWVSQASFKPPLIMVAIKADSHTHAAIEKGGTFALNVLGADQKDVAQIFFKPATMEDGKLSGYRIVPGAVTGSPLLKIAQSWVEARVTDSVKGGDHTVYVAEIVAAGSRDGDFKPLILWDTSWTYGG